MTTEVQRRNVRVAAEAIAPLAGQHSILIVHGNGPQVGLLSLQAEAYEGAEPYPLDVLDAGTQGMIGYLIQQELRSLLPSDRQVVTMLTMIVVDPADAAFANPTKFVGPVYPQQTADALAAEKGWSFRQDGQAWRRVVPSPADSRRPLPARFRRRLHGAEGRGRGAVRRQDRPAGSDRCARRHLPDRRGPRRDQRRGGGRVGRGRRLTGRRPHSIAENRAFIARTTAGQQPATPATQTMRSAPS